MRLGGTAALSLWTIFVCFPTPSGLLDELRNIALDRLAPDVVALGAQVQVVRHDLARQAAVLVQELLADVLEEHTLPIVQVGDEGIDLGDFLVQLRRRNRPPLSFQIPDQSVQALDIRFLLLQLLVDGFDGPGYLLQAPLGIAGTAAREDAQDQDLDLRLLALQLLDNGLDATGDLLGGMAAGVVGADHDDRRLGLEVVQLMAFSNAPKNVAGLVAADAEVHRLEGAEVFLPGFLAFPTVRDGIAQEDDVTFALALLDPFEEVLVPRDVGVEFLGRGVVRGLVSRGQDGRQQAECHHAAGGDQTVHGTLACARASPGTLPGILSNGWLV